MFNTILSQIGFEQTAVLEFAASIPNAPTVSLKVDQGPETEAKTAPPAEAILTSPTCVHHLVFETTPPCRPR